MNFVPISDKANQVNLIQSICFASSKSLSTPPPFPLLTWEPATLFLVTLLPSLYEKRLRCNECNTPALLGIKPNVLKIVLEWQDGQLHVANDAPGAEVDAGQGHDLMDRTWRKKTHKTHSGLNVLKPELTTVMLKGT